MRTFIDIYYETPEEVKIQKIETDEAPDKVLKELGMKGFFVARQADTWFVPGNRIIGASFYRKNI